MPANLHLTRLSALAIASVALTSSLGATETVVKFPRGRSSADLKGTIPNHPGDYHAFVVKARKGQTLGFRLQSRDADAHVIVYSLDLGPADDQITPRRTLTQWSGRLPVTGSYAVQVYGKRARTPFTLTVAIR